MNNERRNSTDRRRRPTPLFCRYTFLGGRRVAPRRTGDSRAVYVDQLGLGMASILLMIFCFHCLDALFTIAYLSQGGRELNPVMGYLLRIGPQHFLVVKLAMAGIGLCFLGLHKNFPWVKAGVAFLFFLYAGVVGYQFFLAFHL